MTFLTNPRQGENVIFVLNAQLKICRSASVNTHGSSSLSKSSSTATSLEDLPWKDVIRRSQDSELPMGVELADLKFSSNSDVLIAITEPFSQQGAPGMQYEVITWNLITGRRLSTLGSHTTVCPW